ncbi:MAG: hypothetical protein ACM34K_00605 [Bacillota bacterium]
MKHSRQIFISVIIAAISFSYYSCKKNDPAGPVNKNADSRSYSWSIDTIRTGTAPLLRLWGSNEKDIWLCGIREDFSRDLFHYDGNKAKPVNLPEAIEPGAVFGFSPADIWVAGDKFYEQDTLCFWHYNGVWSRTAKFNIPGYEICVINDIWGDSPDNVYAAGAAIHINSERVFQSRTGLLFHYDGSQWTRVNAADVHNGFARIRRGIKGSDKYYILSSADAAGNVYTYRDTVKIFEFDGKDVKTLKSIYANRDNGLWLNEIDKQLYITESSKIYRYRNGQPELFLDNPYQNHRVEIWGRNESDIFLAMNDGIAHYNGSNIEYIYKFSADKISISDFIYFQNSVFILAFDSSTMSNIIIKGYSKNL